MSGKQNEVADPTRRKKCPKPAERLPIIIRGIEEDKSNHQIASELGCDEATVRRDLKKLALPAEQQAAIQKGDSVEKHLNEARLRETGVDRSARNKISRRRREDQKSGKRSDLLSGALIRRLSTNRFLDCDAELVLKRAIWYSKSLPDGQPKADNRKFGEVIAPVERESEPDRGHKADEPDLIEHCARELVRELFRDEPVQVIRRSALEKALETVRARGHWTDGLVSRSKKAEVEKDRIAQRRKARDGNEA